MDEPMIIELKRDREELLVEFIEQLLDELYRRTHHEEEALEEELRQLLYERLKQPPSWL